MYTTRVCQAEWDSVKTRTGISKRSPQRKNTRTFKHLPPKLTPTVNSFLLQVKKLEGTHRKPIVAEACLHINCNF